MRFQRHLIFKNSLAHSKVIRQREYHKHGRSHKFLELKENFEEKLRNEKEKYIKKIRTEVAEGRA